jgi:RHS repeat-associated protein
VHLRKLFLLAAATLVSTLTYATTARIDGLNPGSGPVGTQVQINGLWFGATQGSSTVTFNGTNATVASWSDSQITATVPATATTGPVRVTVGGVASTPTNVFFTVPPPRIYTVSPNSGVVGTQVTVNGLGFQSPQGYSAIYFNNILATVTSWSDTQIVATVLANTTTGPVKVVVNNVVSNQDVAFALPNPIITGLSPGSGPVGTQVQINGSGFGANQGSSTAKLNSTSLTIVSWSDNQIVATVPSAATSGVITVTVGGVPNTPANVFFTVPAPQINSVSPTSGVVGTQVTVNGSGFQATQGYSAIYFSNRVATVASWSNTQIVATVAANTTTGPVSVVVNNVASNQDIMFALPNPIITGLSPGSGPVGTQVQINGSGFGTTQGSSTIKFNGTSATIVGWSDNQIVSTVPSAATSGAVTVTVGGVPSTPTNVFFTVPAPRINSISPTSGVVGTQVTVNGSGFQATQGYSTIYFNSRPATVTSWSDTQIIATVAANTTTGPVAVVVNNVWSNQDVVFTMPNPVITGLSPVSGPVGTQVQINGSGFGAAQGSSTVTFNSTNATPTSWSDTQIVATVPSGASTGPVKVIVGGVSSNTLSFTVGNVLVTAVSPKAGPTGTQVTVSGLGFGSSQGSSTISFNNTVASVSSWSATQIVATVPAGATTGAVKVTVGGVASNTDFVFTVGAVAVNTISPTSGPVGTQVQINGSGFGATQGSSTVTFNYVTASIVSWSATQIVATVPSAATTGGVKVTVGGVASNTNVVFTIPGPQVTSISPASGVVGTQVTVNGSGFQATRGSSYITFFPYVYGTVVSWGDTQIVATVPAGATTGPLWVTVNSVGSNQNVVLTLPKPTISGLSPASGPVGTQVQINGSGFGTTQGSNTVTFAYTPASIVSWSDTQVVATVPSAATTGMVQVTVGGVVSTPNVFFTVPAPRVDSISPASGVVGTQVTVNGAGFRATTGSLTLNGTSANVSSWSDTQIVGTVLAGTTTGRVVVNAGGGSSSQNVLFTMPKPIISSLLPASGVVGTQVQISGSGFGSTQGSSTLRFNGSSASIVSWSDTQVVTTVPSTATAGPVTITVGGVPSTPNTYFTIPGPQVSSISPTSGVVGTQVTINGSGFQATRGSSSVYFFSSLSGTVVSWSDTQIVATVPAGATTGPVKVTVNGSLSSQNIVFTMPNPIITGLSPASGRTGTQVQVNGTGFGTAQGSSTVVFNYINASVVSWSDTQIVATVPSTASNGPVKVTVGGVTSNANMYFSVPTPRIDSLSPVIGGVGNPVTITGAYFQSSQGPNIVSFNGAGSGISSWSDTQINAVVPLYATTGPVTVIVNGATSNSVTYTVPSLVVNSVSPTSGPVGTSVTVNGSGFGSTQGTSTITFNGSAPSSITSWSNTQIVAVVSVTTITGPVKVTVSNVNSNVTVNFTVPAPSVSSASPLGGGVGTQVTVTGTGFQATQRDSVVNFNGVAASVVSWSNTQIVATVPASATTGPVTVAVNAIQSNTSVVFAVPNPVITSLSPPSGAVNGTISVNGSGFGSFQEPVQIKLNGTAINPSNWQDTTVKFTVMSGMSSGPVTITRYGVTSNAAQFTLLGQPTISGISPGVGPVGSSVTISGSNFGTTQSNNTVTFLGGTAAVTSWSDTAIIATVPVGGVTGPITVTVAGLSVQSTNFSVNSTVQINDSAGNSSSYTSVIAGGKWNLSDAQGSGCSSCTHRGVIHNTYDNNGNLLSTTDELGRTTTFTYDANKNLTSQSAQVGNTTATTSYTYNGFGEVLTMTDPLNHVTTNTYDSHGNLLSVTTPAPGGGTAASVTQFAYDVKGQLTQITDPLNRITTLTYTTAGLIASITDPQQNVTSYQYDSRGNRTAVIDALQHQTSFAYDAGNRLVTITYPGGATTGFAYDSRGRRTSATDQNGKTTSYTYDDADRLVSVTDAANNDTLYSYDAENNLLSITDANGHVTSFTYDPFGRVTQTAFPSSLAETYAYDAVGNLTSKTDRKGQTIQYVYDALNRMTQKSYPDSTSVDYVYDLVGKIGQVTDQTGTYGFAYDNMGRLIGTSTQYTFLPATTFSNTYTYDAASNRKTLTAPDGSTNTYNYDTLNRLASLNSSLAGQFTFGYDALSRRTQLTRPNGINTNYSYDSLSRLLSVLHQAGGTTIDGASYVYDAAGNRTTKTNQLNNVTEGYTYDPLYQLTQVAQGATTTESYSYDVVGNRLSSLGVSTYAYNSSNQLTSTSDATYTYDNNGNTLTKADTTGTTSFTWDYENRLAQVTLPGAGGTVTFKYDPLGRRIQKSSAQSGTTDYLYDGVRAIEDLDGSGNILARYAAGVGVDEPLAELISTTASYYEQDALGSVTSLSNPSGALVNTYSYDSFGKLASSTGTVANRFQYTGREFDPETGAYHYRARYIDPSTGKFFSEDPVRFFEGPNFYRYVDNNPLNLTDVTGLQAQRPANLPLGTPQQYWGPFADGFAEALNRLNNTNCSELFEPACHEGPNLEGSNRMRTTNYRFVPLRQGPGAGAQTFPPNDVQINTLGLYMTATNGGLRLPNGFTCNLGSITNVRAFILLHELGHQMSSNTGFTEDVDRATNSANSMRIIRACFQCD